MTQRPAGVEVGLDVPARMRDGVVLRANVYRPHGDGPWPTLLARTPYGKDRIDYLPRLDPVQAARLGFMVVIQDTRGRYASDGVWEPFRFERRDGYDSVEWAATLPGSNGRVGMFGDSYVGNTQWLAAAERPPSLAAIAPALTWTDPMQGLFRRGGAVELGLGLAWSLLENAEYLRRLRLDAAELERRLEAIVTEYDGLAERGYWDLPIPGLDVLERHGVTDVSLLRAVADPTFARSCAADPEHVLVPTLHTAGWYDVMQQATLDSFQAMAATGRAARLVVGPWTHVTFTDPIGERMFGVGASRYGAASNAHGDVNDLQLSWLRRYVGDEPSVEAPEAPVRIFVMGRNVWRDESTWPPDRAVEEAWYLHRDTSLGRQRPEADADCSRFSYDPAAPAPTVGGATIMAPAYPAGPRDQAEIEQREDVLVFTSDPLKQDLEVTGRVRVVVYAGSSAPATDWVARLCDVFPDGRSFTICDGILRATETADGVGPYEIDLWSTCNVFLQGHRLRLHVTSSSFPRWDRNLNTGDQHSARYQVAHQRVYHSAERPSRLLLPVIA